MKEIHLHGDFVSKHPVELNLDSDGAVIRIANLEGPIIGLGGLDRPELKAGPNLSSYPRAFDFLDETNDQWIFTLANNHAMDYGWDALKRTISFLSEKGAKVLGAGENQEISRRPLRIQIEGDEVVIISCTHRGIGESGIRTPGVAVAGPWVEQSILNASSLGLKVIVLVHGGTEDHMIPNPGLRRSMISWVRLGANVCVASQSHVPQLIEIAGSGLIVHGMGNLVADPGFWKSHNPVGVFSHELVLGPSLELRGRKFTEFDFATSNKVVEVNTVGLTDQIGGIEILHKRLESLVLDSEKYWSLWQSYCVDFFSRFARRQLYIATALLVVLPISQLFKSKLQSFRSPYLFDLFGWEQNRDLILESLAIKYRVVPDSRSPESEILLREILKVGSKG
jgi:hypothetical protein